MKFTVPSITHLFSNKKVHILLTGFLFLFSFLFGRQIAAFAKSHNLKNRSTVIVLDAGHGGRDPGKVGVNNVLEKDVNLAIVYKLKDLFENKGFTVVLTRTDDNDLSSEASTNHKMEDLTKRVEIMKKNHADLVISIHQNSFTDASSCGPQVFYYGESAESEALAIELQNALDETLEVSDSRGIKCNNGYYIFKNSPAPIAIVECGFLSNSNEADLLSTDMYQNKLARTIYEGACRYLGLMPKSNSSASSSVPQSTE